MYSSHLDRYHHNGHISPTTNGKPAVLNLGVTTLTTNNHDVSGRDGFVLGQAIGAFIYNDVASYWISSSSCADLVAAALARVHPLVIANGIREAAVRAPVMIAKLKSLDEIAAALAALRQEVAERYRYTFSDEALDVIFDIGLVTNHKPSSDFVYRRFEDDLVAA